MIPVGIVFAIVILIVAIILAIQKGFARGGPGATTVLVATDHLMNDEKKRSAEVGVRENSGETLNTPTSDGGSDPIRNSA